MLYEVITSIDQLELWIFMKVGLFLTIKKGTKMKKWLWGIFLFFTISPAYALTIDQMYTATFGHYNQTYDPNGYTSQQSFMIFSQADYYVLNDGSSWDSGAGWHPAASSTVESIEIDNDTIIYNFFNPSYNFV